MKQSFTISYCETGEHNVEKAQHSFKRDPCPALMCLVTAMNNG
ncbi:hypothetical protein SOVF_140550 [Spinacia oleracea]|nr:hypothetical protein SOVF_140550 [Spinacia oleracea]